MGSSHPFCNIKHDGPCDAWSFPVLQDGLLAQAAQPGYTFIIVGRVVGLLPGPKQRIFCTNGLYNCLKMVQTSLNCPIWNIISGLSNWPIPDSMVLKGCPVQKGPELRALGTSSCSNIPQISVATQPGMLSNMPAVGYHLCIRSHGGIVAVVPSQVAGLGRMPTFVGYGEALDHSLLFACHNLLCI